MVLLLSTSAFFFLLTPKKKKIIIKKKSIWLIQLCHGVNLMLVEWSYFELLLYLRRLVYRSSENFFYTLEDLLTSLLKYKRSLCPMIQRVVE